MLNALSTKTTTYTRKLVYTYVLHTEMHASFVLQHVYNSLVTHHLQHLHYSEYSSKDFLGVYLSPPLVRQQTMWKNYDYVIIMSAG